MMTAIVVAGVYASLLLSAWMLLKIGPRRLVFFSPAFLFILYAGVFSIGSSVQLFVNTGNLVPILVPVLFCAALAGGAVLATATLFSAKRRIGLQLRPMPSVDRRYCKWLVFIGAGATAIYYALAGTVPLMHLISSAGGDLSQARGAITYANASGTVKYFGQGYLNAFVAIFMPLATIVLAQDDLVRHGRVGMSAKWLLSVVWVIQLFSGQIWPAMLCALVFVVGLANAYLWSPYNNRVSIPEIAKRIALYVCIGVAIIFAMRWAQQIGGRIYYGDGFFRSTVERIFATPSAQLYEIFPAHRPFEWGATWLNDILGFLPGKSQSFSYESYYLVYGIRGYTLAPTFITSTYINFGIVLGVVVIFIIGFAIQVIYYSLVKHSTNVFYFGVASFFATYEMFAASADIASVVGPAIYVVVVVIGAKCFRITIGRLPIKRSTGRYGKARDVLVDR